MKPKMIEMVLGLLALAVANVAAAEEIDPFYRVEVLVFVHTDGQSDARPESEITDFAALRDPLDRAPATVSPDEEDRRAALELIEILEQLEEDPLMPEVPAWPEPFVALEELSDRMADARKRISSSGRYELLASRAWHQPLSRQRPSTPVRIHDSHVIEADWVRMKPTGIPAIEAPSRDDGNALSPEFHYRLDGGVTLSQRQFMHLEVDLEWRVPDVAGPMLPYRPLERDHDYVVHRMRQTRTVRPDRLEYFDSAWLGVLVLIEELEPLDGSEIDPEPEEESEEDPPMEEFENGSR